MSPRVILIIVILLLIVFGGMALTMKRAADKRRDRTAWECNSDHSIKRCFIA